MLIDSKTNSEDLCDKSPIEKIRILRSKGFPTKETHLDIEEVDAMAIDIRAGLIAKDVYEKMHSKIYKH